MKVDFPDNPFFINQFETPFFLFILPPTEVGEFTESN